MTLEIRSPELPAIFELRNDPPSGVSVRVPPVGMQRAPGLESLALAILEFGKDIAIGILAAWLYERFSNRRSTHIMINQHRTEINITRITEVIQEISSEQQDKRDNEKE